MYIVWYDHGGSKRLVGTRAWFNTLPDGKPGWTDERVEAKKFPTMQEAVAVCDRAIDLYAQHGLRITVGVEVV